MAGAIIVRIDGLDELRRKLNSGRVEGPIERFLDRGAIFIQSRARAAAPVDTGRLRNSIAVDSPDNRHREIGTNVDYAPYVEFGTRPHWPPVGAVAPWARRHGMEPFMVARAISRSGTKAQPFMRPAATEGEAFVKSLVPMLAAEIEIEHSR